MAEVALQNVRKTYPGGFQAVHDFSLQIADGEFVVLVGPSGCGKSTTLRMIAGLEDITSGTISIGTRVVNDVHPKDRDIAMVFQNYALYPHMTVYKNMAFALKLRGVPKAEIEKRVRDAARILGLEDLLERKPKALSGGQRQRVAVGRAIVREPKAFLFDEPLSNLDAKLRVTTRAELKSLHHRLKTTTVYVTHDQEEAMTLADRIVVMSKGLVQQVGPPLEVYQRPANRFVAGFIGTPPMNFAEGTLRESGGGLTFEEGGAASGAAFTLAVPSSRVAALRAYVGKGIVLGLRPQMLTIAEKGQSGTIPLAVRVVEPLGDAVDVIGGTGRHGHMVARVGVTHNTAAASTPVKPPMVGDSISLRVDMERAHFFEPGEFGKSIGEVGGG
jgi:multiple sugar transport system ATP-binding protein